MVKKYTESTVVKDNVDKISYIASRFAACDTMKSTMVSEFSTLLASPTRTSRVSLAVNTGLVALAAATVSRDRLPFFVDEELPLTMLRTLKEIIAL